MWRMLKKHSYVHIILCKIGFFSLTLCLLFPNISTAQTTPVISLVADSIFLNQSTGILIATGNVQIYHKGRLLTAAEIRYDSHAGNISATGPITIHEENGTVITAEFAQLSKDLRSGIILGARLLLAEQLQIAAAEMRRTDGRFNTMSNVVASSCRVCADRPTPVWQIRAAKIVHDEKARRIYFSDATLEVFGFPIAFLPYMRIPSPDVTRASGFLVPTFLSSEYFGNGLKLPYYLTLGHHADATITPTFTLDGAQIIDAEYRQRFQNGGFDMFGALALKDTAGAFGRGFFKLKGGFAFRDSYALTFDITTVSDTGFMKQFGYDTTDRIVSEIVLNRYKEDQYFSLASAYLLSLRDDEDNATIPFVIPEISYRKYYTDLAFGSKVGYEINSVGLFRKTGQDVARLGASADWRLPVEFAFGIRAAVFARADLNFYRVWDTLAFPDRTLINFHPTIGAELKWPLIRQTSNGSHVFEPIVQFLYTDDPNWNDIVPNEDSLQAEFDETNLFNFSRYPGRDASETGHRANIGATYTILDDDGWNIGLAGGVVLRSDTTSQFTQDFLGAINFALPPNFSFANRFLFDEKLTVKRAESKFDLTFSQWDVGGTFVYLYPDPLAGSPIERGEGTLHGRYRFAPNWEINMNWTRDFVSGAAVSAGGGITYGNECIEIGLSLSRRFTTSNIVPATTDIDLIIKLAGFGGNTEDKWPASRCSY